MSWIGLRHKGIEPLFPEEWNAVVDALDILYMYCADLRTKYDCVEGYLQLIYDLVKPPINIETFRLLVGTEPVPLSDVDKIVKRIHIKVPSWAMYLVYIGDLYKQDFVLEPRDQITLEISNPRKVYVRSLGNVEVFVALEE